MGSVTPLVGTVTLAIDWRQQSFAREAADICGSAYAYSRAGAVLRDFGVIDAKLALFFSAKRFIKDTVSVRRLAGLPILDPVRTKPRSRTRPMARQKTARELVRAKLALAKRLVALRSELYGNRGAPELARLIGIPCRTWYNYEKGVTVPAENHPQDHQRDFGRGPVATRRERTEVP